MKSMNFLRKKAGVVAVIVIVYCLAVTISMTSCQKEEQAQEPQTNLLIDECKAFYENQVKAIDPLNASPSEVGKGGSPFPKRAPRWDRAITRSISRGQSFAIPLSYEGNAFVRSTVNLNEISLDAISYLLVYKDEAKAMHAEIVYLFHDGLESFTSETDKSFTGVVLVDDLKGNSIRGFRVLPPSQDAPPITALKGGAAQAKADCFVVEYYTMCSLDGGATWGTPRLTSTRIECSLNVFGHDSDGGGGGTVEEDYLPTGGSNGTTPAQRTLTTSESAKLTSTRTDLSKDCATNNALSAVWGGLNFKIDAAISSPAQYNPFTNTLTFRSSSDINANSTIEELFHAYQNATYPGGTTAYTRGKPGYTNIEFEAKLFKDIYENTYGGMTSGSQDFPQSEKDEYNRWVFSIAMQGLTPSLMEQYNKMLGYFNKYSKEYGGHLLSSLNSPSSINKSKSGCN